MPTDPHAPTPDLNGYIFAVTTMAERERAIGYSYRDTAPKTADEYEWRAAALFAAAHALAAPSVTQVLQQLRDDGYLGVPVEKALRMTHLVAAPAAVGREPHKLERVAKVLGLLAERLVRQNVTTVMQAHLDDAVIALRLGEATLLNALQELRVERLRSSSVPAATPEKERCVLGEYCRLHGFVHGAEAEELRERFEKLADDDRRNVKRSAIRRILDDVDARDSCAFLESKSKLAALPAAAEGNKEQKSDVV